MKIIDLIQGESEWLRWRSFKISSTDAASIMGINPYETPLQCFERKLTGKEKEVNNAMARGKILEPMARDWINAELGTNYQAICVEHDEYPFLAASLDGWDVDAIIPLLEVKCPINGVRRSIPDYEFCQLQHQMLVTGARQVRYLSFHELESNIIECNRNDTFCEELLTKSKDFYQRLLDCNPPEPGPKDWETITTPEALKAAEALAIVRTRKKLAEEEEEFLEKELIEMTGNKNAIVGDMKITRVIRKGAIEYGKIEALQGLDLDKYRKPYSNSWRISSSRKS